MERISKERWQEAQQAERKCHTYNRKEGEHYYKRTYETYFNFLGIKDMDKVVIEIGCADFPALQHIKVKKGILVETMPSPILEEISKENNLEIIKSPVEEIELPLCDEIWLLNVMQHVIDPELFIEKCKKSAKVIRFFEPIDWPIEVYHPHTFTLEWYKGHFPDAKLYSEKLPYFHEAKCAYGIWLQV